MDAMGVRLDLHMNGDYLTPMAQTVRAAASATIAGGVALVCDFKHLASEKSREPVGGDAAQALATCPDSAVAIKIGTTEMDNAIAIDNDSLRMGEATRTITGDHESRVSDTGTSILVTTQYGAEVAGTLRAEGADGMPCADSGQNALAVRTANTHANGRGIADEAAHTLDRAQGQAIAVGFMIGPSAKTGSIGAQIEQSPTLDTGSAKGVSISYDGYNQTATEESCMTLRSAMTGTEGNDADPKVVVGITEGAHGVTVNESSTALQGGGGKPGQGYPAIAIGFKGGQSADGGLGDEVENAPTLSHNQSALEPTVAIGIDQQGGKSSAATAEDISPTMLSDSHGTPNAVAFAQNTRDETRLVGGDGQNAGALAAEPGMKQQTYVSLNHIVRRLTPVECERLQGFPDGWTRIPFRGKPAEECPDSPRYKALGNSWATNCAEWILRRIVAADRLGLIP